ncbi:hypothetical protein [Nitrosomonas halophila]|uniref:Uncharacterized protein n=1 Tax=Nitrosomonas halophila TaxID=44576 RepID=A0A1H3C5T4_9PROT|nr:hypothetical protein [Nitrosomonas halophila]SDX49513.1 hypothetical protein SAMN05421881_100276 [Nitrosomonas halophila]
MAEGSRIKQTSETTFETVIKAALLNDGYHELTSIAFDTERGIFPDNLHLADNSAFQAIKSD